MRCRMWVVAAVGLVAGPATADRATPPRDPDPAALIQGDWVVTVVEHDGIVTPQLPTPAERLWNQRWAYWTALPEKRDLTALRQVPPALPPDVPVLRFGGGRVTVWEDGRPVRKGEYRIEGAARRPVLVVTWGDPIRVMPEPRRALLRPGGGTMAWCWDWGKPDGPPARFAADTNKQYIVTLRRVG